MIPPGLTQEEVKERVAKGEINSTETQVSRSYKDIFVKNVCTTFNLILFTLGAVFILIDEPLNALATVGIITLNIIIATIQEMKAKRRLDKIALLLRPKVRIMRDGMEILTDQNEIVKDDVIHLTSGDQALVDGELIYTYNLEMDESLLTGESSTRRKKESDTVYSGSFCITGEGYFRVTAFGEDSYASKMLSSAKKFENKNTPLQRETNTVTKVLMIIAFLYLGVFMLSSFLKGSDLSLDFLRDSTTWAAAILDIVPIALFLLVVIAYMIAAIRMADSGVLLQQSNAVESMSHVDTVCMDKTGTITTNKLVFEELIPLMSDEEEVEMYLRLFASATGSKNRTIEAIVERYGTEEIEPIEEILFSSERKYSAVKVERDGKQIVLYMGAPSVLKEHLTSGGKRLDDAVLENSKKGLRTVLLTKGDRTALYNGETPVITSLRPVALITISDEVRPDCRETMQVFLDNNMDLKVISGDDPETVNALFTLADIPGERRIISGEEYDRLEGEEKVWAIMETNIFGRMKPDNKEEIIVTLKENGRYVAMVGDGVNDVKALKKANVGVALESGSSAARGVSDIVLLKDRFSALPKALVEGKRTVSGMRDILKLYLTRNFVVALLIPVFLVIGSVPFLPTSSAFYAFMTVSIVAFLMVIWAQPREEKGPVLPGVLRFAIPSAVMLFLFAIATYSMFYVFSGPNLGWIEIDYLDLYGAEVFTDLTWNRDISDPIAAAQEVNARNAMLLFLTVAGIIQIYFIAPPLRFFSIDGNVTKDLRPAILGLLLLLLTFVVYGQENLLHILYMTGLGDYRPIVYLMVLLWFFVARTVVRKGKLKKFTDMTERMLNKAGDRVESAELKAQEKELNNAAHGKGQ